VTELDRAKNDGAEGAGGSRGLQMDSDRERGAAGVGVEKHSDHPCFQCVQCCTYVAIEIDAPTTMKEYDYILWYLYHQGVSVFVDWEKSWYIKFETRCEHLTPTGLCDIYSSRPAICKDFDWRECENRVRDQPADKWLFESSDDFLRWFEKRRPKAFKRFKKYMRAKHGAKEDKELKRLRITELLPPPSGR
jgi:hypothetical protein